MELSQSKRKILLTCSKKISPFLRKELEFAGFPIVSEKESSVETEGTFNDCMKLNLSIRTGQRILFLIEEFFAKNPSELYKRVVSISWEDYIPQDGYVSVLAIVDNPTVTNSLFINQKCKDAIVDRIKEKCGQRPDSGPSKNKAVIYVYWKKESCSVYLDTSGEPLSKRGYRKLPFQAPMQESLAAAVIQATGWEGKGNFVSPMCGSGTLAIEAALIALHKSPGLLRSNYGFMHFKGFDKNKWYELRKEAKAITRKSFSGRILATDINPQAIEAAQKNAKTAGVDNLIEFQVRDYSNTILPEGGGIVILNPDYGQRRGQVEQLKDVYRGIGDFFKNQCQGYTGYIFTGNFELAKEVGLRTKRRVPFFNSTIECRLMEYELYKGSRKVKCS